VQGARVINHWTGSLLWWLWGTGAGCGATP
jgi:hypothetical protein